MGQTNGYCGITKAQIRQMLAERDRVVQLALCIIEGRTTGRKPSDVGVGWMCSHRAVGSELAELAMQAMQNGEQMGRADMARARALLAHYVVQLARHLRAAELRQNKALRVKLAPYLSKEQVRS
jgi:hypothetical protein